MSIKQKTIDHYNRMIEWVKKNIDNPDFATSKPDYYNMKAEIKENWYSDYCPFCKKYHDDTKYPECTNCPLELVERDTDGKYTSCCGGLWDSMAVSKTWDEWIIYAERIVKLLETLEGLE